MTLAAPTPTTVPPSALPSDNAEQTCDLQHAVSGMLHVYVAFDWGEHIDLEMARKLVASEQQLLPRRRRTPPSIAYRPPPLNVRLPDLELTNLAELGTVRATVDATLFDFGAASLALHVPFSLPARTLRALAARLGDEGPQVETARRAMQPLFEQLLVAIQQPQWSPLTEEYVVFHFGFQSGLPAPAALLEQHAPFLASLIRLEDETLSPEEIADSLRLRIRYTPADLFVPEWPAAVLIDEDCEETLQTIELANLQLLELRHIDQRLDDRLEEAYKLIHHTSRRHLPIWRTHSQPLRALGDLKLEAAELLERSSNVLKLVGSQYLARVYRQLAARFHLEAWGESIERSLEVTQSVYQVLSDQAATYRTELLEIIIILLIAFEIVLAILGVL